MHLSQEQLVVQGDLNMLEQSLHQYGLSAGDIKELKEALDEDGGQNWSRHSRVVRPHCREGRRRIADWGGH